MGMGIGIIGCGAVGSAVVRRLRDQGEDVVIAAVRHPRRTRNLDGPLPPLTTDPNEVVDHPDVAIVIEVAGGFGTIERAIDRALRLAKPVVTANKALIAANGTRLESLAASSGVPLLYEAAVCGGVPILRMLDGLAADTIVRLDGVMNGIANYILDRLANGIEPEQALREAQEEGFAEADATRDINGLDSADKLVILSRRAFRRPISLSQVKTEGIDGIRAADAQAAHSAGLRWRLVASAVRGASLRVEPILLPFDHPLASGRGADSVVLVTTERSGTFTIAGPGAGGEPTATTVLSDVAIAAQDAARLRKGVTPTDCRE